MLEQQNHSAMFMDWCPVANHVVEYADGRRVAHCIVQAFERLNVWPPIAKPEFLECEHVTVTLQRYRYPMNGRWEDRNYGWEHRTKTVFIS